METRRCTSGVATDGVVRRKVKLTFRVLRWYFKSSQKLNEKTWERSKIVVVLTSVVSERGKFEQAFRHCQPQTILRANYRRPEIISYWPGIRSDIELFDSDSPYILIWAPPRLDRSFLLF